jgi:hypothetical protein
VWRSVWTTWQPASRCLGRFTRCGDRPTVFLVPASQQGAPGCLGAAVSCAKMQQQPPPPPPPQPPLLRHTPDLWPCIGRIACSLATNALAPERLPGHDVRPRRGWRHMDVRCGVPLVRFGSGGSGQLDCCQLRRSVEAAGLAIARACLTGFNCVCPALVCARQCGGHTPDRCLLCTGRCGRRLAAQPWPSLLSLRSWSV